MRLVSKLFVGAVLSLGLIACKKEGAPAPAPAAKPADGALAAAGKPVAAGSLVLPELGAADVIEPPSRDVLPGMTYAEAQAKGAKLDGDDLSLREGVRIGTDSDVKRVTFVGYDLPAAEAKKLAAKWGKPTIGDHLWIGANFAATFDASDCTVDTCEIVFERSPRTMFDKTVRPPLVFGGLRIGMPETDVVTATGIDFGNISSVEIGYPFSISVRTDGLNRLSAITHTADGKDGVWLPFFKERWGEPQKLGDDVVWFGQDSGWVATYDEAGNELRFYAFIPAQTTYFAKTGERSIIEQTAKSLGKTAAEVKAALPAYVESDEVFPAVATEFSLDDPRVELYFTDEKVTRLEATFPFADEAARDRMLVALTAAWGAPTKGKNDDGDEIQTFKVEGLTATLEIDESSINVKLRK